MNPNELRHSTSNLKAPLSDANPFSPTLGHFVAPQPPPPPATSEMMELMRYVRAQDNRLALIEETMATQRAQAAEARAAANRQKEELLKGVVLIGTGILAGITMAAFGGAMKEARKSDMEQLKNDLKNDLKFNK